MYPTTPGFVHMATQPLTCKKIKAGVELHMEGLERVDTGSLKSRWPGQVKTHPFTSDVLPMDAAWERRG